MGREQGTNEELNTDRNFENKVNKEGRSKSEDPDGRTNPQSISGTDHAQKDIENDGGGARGNNGADKSGR